MSGNTPKNFFDHAKKTAADALKATSKRVIQETAEPPGGLIGNKIANRIRKVSKPLPQNNSKTNTNEHDKEVPNT